MVELSVEVSIEEIINKTMLQIAQEIYDKYKVKICNLDLLRLNISTCEKKDYKAVKVCMNTEYEGK